MELGLKFVLLKIHWDGGWVETHCTLKKQAENNAKQKALWKQIATCLRDFDQRLLFCSDHKPNGENSEQIAALNSYHQTFANAVRSTDGQTSYRVLALQGPSTDIEKTIQLMTSLPANPVPNRLMVEVHFYMPYNFCLMRKDADWGKMACSWTKDHHSATDPDGNVTRGEEDTVDKLFGLMKTQFVDKAIPVVLGEYDAMVGRHWQGEALTRHLASRAYISEMRYAAGHRPRPDSVPLG